MSNVLSLLLTPYTAIGLLLAYYLIPYLLKARWIAIPAPFPAALTNFWLFYQCRRGRRFLAVHRAHEKYGKVIRIQPNHVSIADDDAIQTIYGHGNGFLKSYDNESRPTPTIEKPLLML
jgi:benzoate 4-monooxygenase